MSNYDKALLKDKAFLQELMERMMIVRKFEQKVQWLFAQGFVYGTTHLGVGEEGANIGTTAALHPDDYMLATHRGHGAALGKGADVNLMMAEILARETGLNKGKGGSMHIADFDKGILGAIGILGANGPIACGVAFTSKRKKLGRVCAAFFGDGASNEGAIHESMNLAAAWGLPVMFVLINNTYGMSTPLRKVVHDMDLTKRAIPYGIKSYECDGNDILETYTTCRDAREYCEKNGPVLIVEHTYRTSGHSKSDGNLYRSKEEIKEWEAKNPVKRFTDFLLENKLFTQEDIDAMDKKTTDIIEKAVEFAKSCPEPKFDAEQIQADVYAK